MRSPISCSHCDKFFSKANELKVHKRMHTGEKLYPCPDCDTFVSQLNDLKRHKRTHTDEKHYLLF